MKILAVRGKNLASLAGHFEVDFCKPPLDRAGLIAITGPTGAGKTTLLDAMCLALFDRTPRFASRGGGVMIGGAGEADGLRALDVRGILRHGAVEGWAEVDFLGVDDRRWRARWEVRRARGRADGRVQAQQMSLLDPITGRPQVADRKGDVLEAIEQRLGLDFDQFRRSVLLAQGEFAAFLEASGNERAELLERMTGTGVYRALGRGAFERAKLAEQELALLGRERALLKILDDDAQGALAALVEDRRRALAAATERQTIVEAALRWHRQRVALEQAAAEAEARRRTLEAEVAGLAEREQALAWIERLAPLRAHLAEDARLRAEVEAREGELSFFRGELTALIEQRRQQRQAVEAAELALGRAQERRRAMAPAIERARELDARRAGIVEGRAKLTRKRDEAQPGLERTTAELAQVEAALEQARAGVQARAQWLATHRDLARLADAWGHYRLLLRNQLRDRQLADQEAARIEGELTPRLQRATAALAEAKGEWEAARKQRNQARARVRKLERELGEQPAVAGLRARARALEQARARAEGLRRLFEDAQRSAAHSESLAGERRDQELDRSDRLARSRALEAALAGSESAFVEAQRALRQLEAIRDLAGHRSDLRPGEACPLCGALEHPHAGEAGPVDEAIGSQRERVAELLRRRDDLQREQGEQQSRAEVARQRLAQIDRAQKEQAGLRAELQGRWRTLLAEGPLLPGEGESENESESEGEQERSASSEQLSLLGGEDPRGSGQVPAQIDDPAVQPALWSVFTALEHEAGALDGIQRRVDELLERQRDRQARRDEAEQRWEGAREALDRIDREQQQLARDLADGQLRLEALTQEIDERWTELLDTVPAALACIDDDDGGDGDEGEDGDEREGRGGDPIDLPARLAAEGRSLIDALGDACDRYREQLGRHERGREAQATLETRRAELAAALAARREQVEGLGAELRELDGALEALATERAAVLEGQAVAAVVRALEGEVQLAQGERDEQKEALGRLETDLRGLEIRVKSLEAQGEGQRAQLEAAEAAATREREALALEPEALAALLADASAWDEAWQREARATIDRARSALERQRAVAEERRRVWAAHGERPPVSIRDQGEAPGPATDPALDDETGAAAELRRLDAAITELRARLLEVELDLRRDADARRQAEALAPQLRARERDARIWGRLRDAIGSATGDKFQRFAQSLTLELLLAQANAQLRALKPRYSLARVPKHDLELQLIDHDLGDEVRSIRGLSGGESFLVSLALALALASLSAEDCRIDSLFIDEGFGSLDAQSLDVAVSTLDALQAEGRQIGVISHVPGLAERVGVEIQVQPQSSGRSTVRVVGVAKSA